MENEVHDAGDLIHATVEERTTGARGARGGSGYQGAERLSLFTGIEGDVPSLLACKDECEPQADQAADAAPLAARRLSVPLQRLCGVPAGRLCRAGCPIRSRQQPAAAIAGRSARSRGDCQMGGALGTGEAAVSDAVPCLCRYSCARHVRGRPCGGPRFFRGRDAGDASAGRWSYRNGRLKKMEALLLPASSTNERIGLASGAAGRAPGERRLRGRQRLYFYKRPWPANAFQDRAQRSLRFPGDSFSSLDLPS